MGVDRISYVKDLCKAHGKVMPLDDEIPQTSISTDLKEFVLSLMGVTKITKPKKSSEDNGNKQKGKSVKKSE
tara:strand:+ start:2774 stop:2989 length:216 start_codon:yes stop_codon:yes gene_type:complete